MARMGMDVDVVEQASRDLKQRATDITTLMAQIDKTVTHLGAVWDGQDATEFVQNWWPAHKKNMTAIASSIQGLGQSAWNNAQQQRDASGK
jgi:uncharacterized protein YukE